MKQKKSIVNFEIMKKEIQRNRIVVATVATVDPVTKSISPVTKSISPVTKSISPVTKSISPVTKSMSTAKRGPGNFSVKAQSTIQKKKGGCGCGK